MENSLDAKSTSINVLVKEGGLKLLQIQDNGHGIKREDMDIVCERFTTSKMQEFEDLRQIATFGFRGEALASISHVAHVTITSKTAEQPVAYKGRYADGILVPARPGASADPTPCAGKTGTQITVEDLFYNVVTRRRALRNPNDEWKRIHDVISRYAVHFSGVSFTLKKHGETAASIHTQVDASVIDNIRILYGPDVSRELLRVEKHDPGLQFKLDGYVTNANYSKKVGNFILFINHRLVESPNIKKAVEGIYADYLPKNTHPFIYLSLEMAPQNVDVNVHPTKRQVHFLREDTVVETIQKALETTLHGSNSSRTFYPSTTPLPGMSRLTPIRNEDIDLEPVRRTGEKRKTIDGEPDTPASPAPQHRVRSDVQSQTLDGFVTRQVVSQSPSQSIEGTSRPSKRPHIDQGFEPVLLTSIQNIISGFEGNSHYGLSEVFKNHTFVGCVNNRYAVIQHRTKLYLCNIQIVSREFLYQEGVHGFSRFLKIRFADAVPISYMLRLALDDPQNGWVEADGPKEDIIDYIVNVFKSRAPMLREYFMMDVDEEGNLCTLPQVIPDLVPNMDYLPDLLLALGGCDWQDEQKCFESVLRELANFFVIGGRTALDAATDQLPAPTATTATAAALNGNGSDGNGALVSVPESALTPTPVEIEGDEEAQAKDIKDTEQLLFPTIRLRRFCVPKEFSNNGTVVQLACLDNLYKIFERC
eukprot:TRINITY_DN6345_c0_g1_i1.p1 TRINITY_DN6345_c0_g1~~TRINITY_DN6345_c0_g1_i1.p1  ORF type:complete len:775 (+),score=111.00 TRINITY_DN6345_c0_g1_i1:215-2326(+)